MGRRLTCCDRPVRTSWPWRTWPAEHSPSPTVVSLVRSSVPRCRSPYSRLFSCAHPSQLEHAASRHPRHSRHQGKARRRQRRDCDPTDHGRRPDVRPPIAGRTRGRYDVGYVSLVLGLSWQSANRAAQCESRSTSRIRRGCCWSPRHERDEGKMYM